MLCHGTLNHASISYILIIFLFNCKPELIVLTKRNLHVFLFAQANYFTTINPIITKIYVVTIY